MKTIRQWFRALLALLGIINKQIHAADDTGAQESNWNPFVAAAVERERQTMILYKLYTFMNKHPRPWWGNHVAATMRKRQRRNARVQMEKRLHSRRGLQ